MWKSKFQKGIFNYKETLNLIIGGERVYSKKVANYKVTNQ